MSKYASLPDIDTAPDVYETPDLPVIHVTERDDDSDNDGLPPGSHSQSNKAPANSDINKEPLDQSTARHKFRSASGINGSDADFSASLLRKQPRKSFPRYPVPTTRRTFETDEYSILPRGYAIEQGDKKDLENETPLDRLRRLRFEVDQLEEELEQQQQQVQQKQPPPDPVAESEKNLDLPSEPAPKSTAQAKSSRPGPTPTELLAELQHIRDQLEKLSASKSAVDPLSTSASQLRDREAYAKSLLLKLTQRGPAEDVKSSEEKRVGSSAPISKATTAAQLDSRLNALEDLLGSRSLLQSANNGDISFPPPLLVTISKLEHQLSLLTQPRHLDSISRRVKVIVTDLERVHEARRKLTDNRPLSIALASGITVVTQNQAGSLQSNASSTVHTSLSSLPGVISTGDPGQASLPPDALHKLERLYNLLPRLDPLLPLVPHLLSRLRSLAQVHTNADQFRHRLDHSTLELNGLAARSLQLAELIKQIERNFDANDSIVQQNLGLVAKRIENLLESLEKIQPA